jgi:hypothetical protein
MKLVTLLTPTILAWIPSFSLIFTNREVVEIPLFVSFLAFAFMGLANIVLVLGWRFLVKDWTKAIIITSFIVCIVFYYGFFFDIVKGIHLGDMEVGRHRYAILLWVASFSMMGLFVWRTKRDLRQIGKIGKIFVWAFFGVILSSFLLGVSGSPSPRAQVLSVNEEPNGEYVKSSLGYVPDVYFIVPDAYANSKVLRDYFGYDNEDFHSYLKDRGFVIVEESESNYPNTHLSLPTTLNMEYGDTLIPEFLSISESTLREFIEENRTVHLFKKLGYQYVAITSDNTAFNGRSADVRYGKNLLFRVLIKPTIFDPFSYRRRERILNAFNSLQNIGTFPSPKFVFAHIVSPHDPYVFGPDGEEIGIHTGERRSAEDMELYLGQVKFVNKKLQEAIDSILASSSHIPIIVLQSDHGVHLSDSHGEEVVDSVRLKNFSAYLLPGEKGDALPPSIDSVNTFRFIFDQYFGTSFGLLDDEKEH